MENFRCARCGVDIRPYGIRAINREGKPLELCKHHGDEHGPALTKQQWTVVPIATILEVEQRRDQAKAGEPA